MATTYTSSAILPGQVLLSWDSLALGDTTAAVSTSGASRMLVQFTGGTFDGATINLQNSLDGVTFVPMYESFVTTSGPVTNVTTPAAVNATAAGVKVYHGLVTPFFRIEITGGTSPTGLKVRVLLVQ